MRVVVFFRRRRLCSVVAGKDLLGRGAESSDDGQNPKPKPTAAAAAAAGLFAGRLELVRAPGSGHDGEEGRGQGGAQGKEECGGEQAAAAAAAAGRRCLK